MEFVDGSSRHGTGDMYPVSGPNHCAEDVVGHAKVSGDDENGEKEGIRGENGLISSEQGVNNTDEEDDEDDDYFDRLQSYVDAQDDEEEENTNKHPDDGGVNGDGVVYKDDDEYYSAVLDANTSNVYESSNALILPEDSMVWQFVMRDIATTTISSKQATICASSSMDSLAGGHSGFIMIGQDDTSILTLTRQWLFNNLPNSSNVYCWLGYHLLGPLQCAQAVHKRVDSVAVTDLNTYKFWVNDVTTPTIAFAAKFPSISSSASEITIELFYDPILEPYLSETQHDDKQLVDWKAVCKEIVGTVESEWERIQFVRDACRSPYRRGVNIMFAASTQTFYEYFVTASEMCMTASEEAEHAAGSAVLASNGQNKVWTEEFMKPCYMFVADSVSVSKSPTFGSLSSASDGIVLPEGYHFVDLT
jgi:hypothetical protein